MRSEVLKSMLLQIQTLKMAVTQSFTIRPTTKRHILRYAASIKNFHKTQHRHSSCAAGANIPANTALNSYYVMQCYSAVA